MNTYSVQPSPSTSAWAFLIVATFTVMGAWAVLPAQLLAAAPPPGAPGATPGVPGRAVCGVPVAVTERVGLVGVAVGVLVGVRVGVLVGVAVLPGLVVPGLLGESWV